MNESSPTDPGTNRHSRHFLILLVALALGFTSLIITVVLSYQAQSQIQQLSMDIREIYADWTSLVSTTKSLVSSSAPVSEVYRDFSKRLDLFKEKLADSSVRLAPATQGEGDLAQRLRFMLQGMEYGIQVLGELKSWLARLDSKGVLDQTVLQDFRSGPRDIEVAGYDQLLQTWAIQRIRDLDSTFDQPFAEMDKSLNSIILVDLKTLSWQYLLLAAAFFLACIMLIAWLLVRLRTINRAMNRQSLRLAELNGNLEEMVATRTLHLEQAMTKLEEAGRELMVREKLAQLGTLVAGVAHEINTPMGLAVTASSYQMELIREVLRTTALNSLEANEAEALRTRISRISEASTMVMSNLERASEIIRSFKQLSVDQVGDQHRRFDVAEVIRQTMTSLEPQLKRSPWKVSIDCRPGLLLDSYPGALSQIITNLVQNSLIHGFAGRDRGDISITVRTEGEIDHSQVRIIYRDDGSGIPKKIMPRIFEPFFTTRHNQGGSGLGLSIIYNLVHHRLAGTITCTSTTPEDSDTGTSGTRFDILLPL